MNGKHTIAKHAADIGASGASLFVLASHWAEILTPIITFLVAIATLGWWVIRYREWWKTGGAVAD